MFGVKRAGGGSPRGGRAPLTFLLATLACLLLAPAALAAPPVHLRAPSLDVSGLNHACGVATDSKGDLYAANSGEGEIQVYGPSDHKTPLTSIADANQPCALALTSAGNLYVSEKATGEVVRYKPSEYPPTGSVAYGAREVIDASGKAAGIAVDRVDNRLYVAEGDRVAIYSATGTLNTVNEVQEVSVENATGGSFTLSFEGAGPSKAIEYPEGSAAQVKEALEGLPSIGPGNVEVKRPIEGLFSVTFIGARGAADVPALEADSSGLSGSGSQEVAVKETTKGFDGYALEGELGEATGIAPYTYTNVSGSNARLYLALAENASDELKLFSGPTNATAMKLRSTISGVDADGDPETPDQQLSFGAEGAYVAADPGNESGTRKCNQVQIEGKDQICTAGHLFLYDAGHEAIDELELTGGFVDQLSAPGIADGGPTQVAVQRTGAEGDGTVYASSGAAEGAKLIAFRPLGMPTRSLDEGRSHVLEKAKAIATDFYGYVYVVAQKTAYVFDPEGSPVTEFEIPEGLEIAADSECNVYAVEGPNAPALAYYKPSQCPPTSETTFTKHEPPLLSGEAATNTTAVAVNPADDHVFLTGESLFAPKVLELKAAAEGSGTVGECAGAGFTSSGRYDIDVNAASGEVYVSANARRLSAVTCEKPELLREFKGGGCPSGELGPNPTIAIDQASGHVIEFATVAEKTVTAREYEPGGACVAEFGTFISTFASYRVALDNSCALQKPPLSGEACEEEFPANGTAYVAFDSANKGQKYDVTAFGPLEYPEPGKRTLTVKKTGKGSGTVSSEPKGIDCGSTCVAEFGAADVVTLKAKVDAGSEFEGWEGCDAEPTPSECEVAVGEERTVSARFEGGGTERELTVTPGGPGTGVVMSTPAGIECPSQCTALFFEGVKALLKAKAEAGSEVEGWEGCDSEPSPSECEVEMSAAREVKVLYDVEHPLLSVEPQGAGAGVVTSSPTGIECPATCAHKFDLDQKVTLSAKAAEGSKFIGWGEGECDSEPSPSECEVTMSGPRTVEASFEPLPEAKALAAQPLGYREATLRGEANPEGVEGTSYRFEYLTQAAYEANGNGFEGARSTPSAPLAPGEGFVALSAPITGLEEATAYRFRLVVAASGVGEAEDTGPTFTTLTRPAPQSCPNAAYRSGFSTFLPDCRAYELITPPQTDSLVATLGGQSFNSSWVAPRGAGAGESLGFYANVPEAEATTFRATRGAGEHPEAGWASEGVGFTYAQSAHSEGFHGLAADQRYWLLSIAGIVTPTEDSLPPGAYLRVPAGSANRACAPEEDRAQFEASDAAAKFELVGCGPLGADPEAGGSFVSAGGAHVIFTSKAQLTAASPPAGVEAIYDREAGSAEAELVSSKPEGGPLAAGDLAYVSATEDGRSVLFKAGGALYAHREGATTEVAAAPNTFAGASEDGSRVFFIDATVSGSQLTPRASLYACDLDTGPCAGSGATHAATQVASEALFVNVSPDGSRAYFASQADLTGAEENEAGQAAGGPPAKGTGDLTEGSKTITGVATSEGAFVPGMEISGKAWVRGGIVPLGTTIVSVGAGTLTLSQPAEASAPEEALSAGFPNLYLWDEGEVSFVAILDPRDLVGFRFMENPLQGERAGESLRAWTRAIQGQTLSDASHAGRAASPTRSTPDGGAMVFQSHARLTAYDNEGHGEIYRYAPEAPAGQRLLCVSCDTSGAPPPPPPASYDTFLQLYQGFQGGATQPDTLLPNLTDDGARVFFQSKVALLPADANRVNDVYEWRAPGYEGPGGDVCEAPGGCLALISGGQAETPSVLYGMGADGRDVILETQEKLLAADTLDSYSLYDARVGGGIPEAEQEINCEGDACQGEGSLPPALPFPANTDAGEEAAAPVRHCAKGKHRVKGRCVRKHRAKRGRHHRKHRHRAKHHGRAQR